MISLKYFNACNKFINFYCINGHIIRNKKIFILEKI